MNAKKILGIVAVLALIVLVFAGTVSAGDPVYPSETPQHFDTDTAATDAGYVVRIGTEGTAADTVYYNTIQTAVNGASDGSILYIIKDVYLYDGLSGDDVIKPVLIKKNITIEGKNLGTENEPVYPNIWFGHYREDGSGYQQYGGIIMGTRVISDGGLEKDGTEIVKSLDKVVFKNLHMKYWGACLSVFCTIKDLTVDNVTFELYKTEVVEEKSVTYGPKRVVSLDKESNLSGTSDNTKLTIKNSKISDISKEVIELKGSSCTVTFKDTTMDLDAGVPLVNDTGSGNTISVPWVAKLEKKDDTGVTYYATIADAVDAWNAITSTGDYTITVKNDEYTVNGILIKQNVNGKSLTIKAETEGGVTLQLGSGSPDVIFGVSGESNTGNEAPVTINGFVFDLTTNTGDAVYLLSGGSGSPDSKFAGYVGRYAHDVTISNCTFNGSSKESDMLVESNGNSQPFHITIDSCTCNNIGYVANGYFAPENGGSNPGITISSTTMAGDSKAFLNNQAAGSKAIIDGCTASGNTGKYLIRVSGAADKTAELEIKNSDLSYAFKTVESDGYYGVIVTRYSTSSTYPVKLTVENTSFTKSTTLSGVTLYDVYSKDYTNLVGIKSDMHTEGYNFSGFVAKIGDKNYYTLKSAVGDAISGDTIEILVDEISFTGSDLSKLDNVIIEGLDSYTVVQEAIMHKDVGGNLGNVTFKNFKLSPGSEGDEGGAVRWCYLKPDCTVTFDNCIIDPVGKYGIHFDSGTGYLVVKNSTIKGTVALGEDLKNITFDNCTFAGRGGAGKCNINIYNKAEFKNCDFDEVYLSGSARGILNLEDAAVVDLVNCTVAGVQNNELLSNVFRKDNIKGIDTIDASKVGGSGAYKDLYTTGYVASKDLTGKLAPGFVAVKETDGTDEYYVSFVDQATVSGSTYTYGTTPSWTVSLANGTIGLESVTPKYSTASNLTSPSDALLKDWNTADKTKIDVGTYYMYVTFKVSGSDTVYLSKSTSFTVTQAATAAPVISGETAVTGNSATFTITNYDSSRNYLYRLDDVSSIFVSLAVDENNSFTLDNLNDGSHTVYVKVAESNDKNYTESPVTEKNFTVTTPVITVTYVANGGLATDGTGKVVSQGLNSVKIKSATNLGITRTGYTADNTKWLEKDLTNAEVSVGTAVTAGTTLYAIWKQNTYTVLFDANGGTGSMADQQFTYDVPEELTANQFTRSGYNFAGWALNKNSSAMYADEQKVSNLTSEDDGEVTLYAKWVDKVYAVSGTAANAEGAKVTLVRGSAEIASATVTDGQYSFATKVPAGIYNVVVKSSGGEKTVTTSYEVKEGSTTVPLVTLPTGNVNSIVEVSVKNDTGSVVVTNADKEAEAKAEDGKTVTLTISVSAEIETGIEETSDTKAEEVAVQESIAEIKEKQTADDVKYYNITISKEVDSEKTTLSETTELLKFNIPYDMTGRDISKITVFRDHNGTVEKLLPAESNPSDRTYSIGDNEIIIYSNKFSLYSIGYASGVHTITVNLCSHGSVISQPTAAVAGAAVTLTITPDVGYALSSINATTTEGVVELSGSGNTRTFVMPDANVVVSAEFSAVANSSGSSVTSFTGEKNGNDFTFSNAVVITKMTLPNASYAKVTNTSGSGWYNCNISTDGTAGIAYFQVPLDVLNVKGWTVNDVSFAGNTTTYLKSEGGYAKYSAPVTGSGAYSIGFVKGAATAAVEKVQEAVEQKPATDTPVTPITPVTPVTDTKTTTQTAAKTPFPILGILAGLGIAGLVALRRK